MNWLLKWFGYRVVYVCEWGVYDTRYDSIDFSMERPIHKDMSCAPPWAKLKIVSLTKGVSNDCSA